MTEKSPGTLKKVDNSTLVCVEYPGFVKNVDRMLKTMGGVEQISETYSESSRRLEMCFRPDDPYCHSVFADLYPVNGLLLKVKRRRRKPKKIQEDKQLQAAAKPEDESWEYEQEVLGIVKSVYRFNTLMDYQFLAPPQLWNAFKEVQGSSMLEEHQPLHVPPHIFARINAPGTYFYRPEPTGKRGTTWRRGLDDEDLKETDTRYRKRRQSEALAAIFSTKDIPEKPSEKCNLIIADLIKHVPAMEGPIELLRKAFERRPVWSRAAISCHTNLSQERQKNLLPYFGYYWLNGPWRALWCRLGYDPRTDPKAKIYQMVDVRLRHIKSEVIDRKRPTSAYRPMLSKPVRSGTPVLPSDNADSKSSKDSEDSLPYVFTPNKVPAARQMFYQVCDIHDPDVQDIISENDGKETECTEKEGWLIDGTLARIRAVMLKKVVALIKRIENEKKQEAADTTTEQETEQLPLDQSRDDQNKEQSLDDSDPFSYLQMLQDDDDVEAYSIFGEDDDDSQGFS